MPSNGLPDLTGKLSSTGRARALDLEHKDHEDLACELAEREQQMRGLLQEIATLMRLVPNKETTE